MPFISNRSQLTQQAAMVGLLVMVIIFLGESSMITAFQIRQSRGSIPPDTARLAHSEQNIPTVPVTPCTRICRYNANVFDGQVCIGCFRETYEISTWDIMTPTDKYFALLDASERLEQASSVIDKSVTGTSRDELLRQAEYWKSQA